MVLTIAVHRLCQLCTTLNYSLYVYVTVQMLYIETQNIDKNPSQPVFELARIRVLNLLLKIGLSHLQRKRTNQAICKAF